MKLGYNTNGLQNHRWTDAIALLAEVGYESVAITVDHCCLDPYSPRLADELAQMRELLERHRLISVIETGARFLLNPRVKHEPTLMSPTADERAVRIDFLKRCVDIAAELRSDAVSFWSGILRQDIPRDAGLRRLAEGCRPVIDYAGERGVKLAFEPEPGMFIERMDHYADLLEHVDAPHFGLTIDVGHLQCVEDPPIAAYLRTWSGRLFHVHIEDMRRGIHDHLRFGEGEIDFVPVLQTLRDVGYAGGVNVELSRHSHMAPDVVRESYAFLREVLDGGKTSADFAD